MNEIKDPSMTTRRERLEQAASRIFKDAHEIIGIYENDPSALSISARTELVEAFDQLLVVGVFDLKTDDDNGAAKSGS